MLKAVGIFAQRIGHSGIQRIGIFQRGSQLLVRDAVVLQVASDVLIVSSHVDEAMTRKIEQNHLLLTSLLALQCLTYGSSDGVAGFGSRDDALGTCEERTCLEGLQLWNIHSFHEAVLQQL